MTDEHLTIRTSHRGTGYRATVWNGDSLLVVCNHTHEYESEAHACGIGIAAKLVALLAVSQRCNIFVGRVPPLPDGYGWFAGWLFFFGFVIGWALGFALGML